MKCVLLVYIKSLNLLLPLLLRPSTDYSISVCAKEETLIEYRQRPTHFLFTATISASGVTHSPSGTLPLGSLVRPPFARVQAAFLEFEAGDFLRYGELQRRAV
jgi:hypothetical protein